MKTFAIRKMESIDNILALLKNASNTEERAESVKKLLELIDQTTNESKRGSIVSGLDLQIFGSCLSYHNYLLNTKICKCNEIRRSRKKRPNVIVLQNVN